MEELKAYNKNYLTVYNIFKEKFNDCEISFEELLIYILAPTETGGTVNPIEILTNKYYLFHELVEICFLKRWGVPIDKYTILMNPGRTYEAHYYAIKEELSLAREEGDYEWIKFRLNHVRDYLDDPNASRILKDKFRRLLEVFQI